MPTIIREDGYEIRIYTLDHPPPHVHVAKAATVLKIDLATCQVIEIVAPQLRTGGYVMNDNAEPDFLEFIRDPANGFLSVTLPLKGGTELSVKVA